MACEICAMKIKSSHLDAVLLLRQWTIMVVATLMVVDATSSSMSLNPALTSAGDDFYSLHTGLTPGRLRYRNHVRSVWYGIRSCVEGSIPKCL